MIHTHRRRSLIGCEELAGEVECELFDLSVSSPKFNLFFLFDLPANGLC